MAGYPAPTPRGEAPLDAPQYNATIKQAFVRYWKKYFTFAGRASRSEFWWWALITTVVSFVLSIVNQVVTGFPHASYRPGEGLGQLYADSLRSAFRASVAAYAWGLVTLIGGLALAVRRLHDTNRRGWWYLIGFVPLVGWIVLLVFYVLPPDPAGARFDKTRVTEPAP
jgi:uncharacterized membrane protein YhaH (DUF805 family)